MGEAVLPVLPVAHVGGRDALYEFHGSSEGSEGLLCNMYVWCVSGRNILDHQQICDPLGDKISL